MKRARIFLFGGAALVVVAVAAAAIWLATLDLNPYRSQIEAAVRDATGRDLTIAGPITVTFGLPLGITVEDVGFANAPWGSRPAMAILDRATVQVRLFPLVRGDVRIAKLTIDGLDLLLETDAAGNGNWAFATASTPADVETPVGGTSATRRGPLPKASTPAMPLVETALITNVAIAYRDGRSGRMTTAALDQLRLDGGDGRAETPLAFELEVVIDGVPVATTGQLTIAPNRYGVTDWVVRAGPSDLAGSLEVVTAGSRPRLESHLASHRLDLRWLMGRGNAGPPAGRPAGRQTVPRRAGDGRVIPDADIPFELLKLVDGRLALSVGTLLLADEPGISGLAVESTAENGTLMTTLTADNLAGGALAGRLGMISATTALDAEVDVQDVDLRQLFRVFAGQDVVDGGQMEGRIVVRGRGDTVRQLLAGADGDIRLVTAGGTFRNTFLTLAGSDVLGQVVDAINPLAQREPVTVVACAVVNGTISDGVVSFERGLAIETNRMTVGGTGTINLADEALDLAVRARAVEGLGVSVAGLVSTFVRIRGTMARPAITVDPLDVVEGAARAGVEALSSVIRGQPRGVVALLRGDPSPCRTALGLPPVPARDASGNDIGRRAEDLLRGVERGVRGLFR